MGDGYPFPNDYQEVYNDRVSDLRDLLDRQLAELNRKDRVQDAAVIGFLRGRRSGRRETFQVEAEVAPTADSDGPRVLLAGREVIVEAEILSGQGVRDAVEAAGFTNRGSADGPFVRLVNNQIRAQEIRPKIEKLTGTPAMPNTLAVTASVGKGVGGPDSVLNPMGAESTFESYRSQARWAPEGPGPIVAVIDTGIPGKDEDGLRTMIRADGWLDDVPRGDGNRDLLDHLPQPDGYLDYQAGHGTFVAGIVQRVAPTAQVRVYRAADTDGLADETAIADALQQAFDEGARIINLSLGMTTENDEPPPVLETTLKRITNDYSDKEVVIIAAAGNFGDRTRCWPAASPAVHAVGALIETEDVENLASARRTGRFETADWSSQGDHIKFWTVGEGVRSTFVTGNESPDFDDEPEVFPPNAWALWSGTSFAAPQIAGAVARLQQERGMTPRQAVDYLSDAGATVRDQQGTEQKGKGLRILSGIPRH
ncbi:S8/S53 family peptidase [Actinoplanes sp. NPDC049596]|uniref:S8 family peptidase n=1 Tax=unclassified Actinoplanes TaxID=2626549 RepID=UPI00342B26BA